MGCDIHLYVEQKNLDSGEWESQDVWEPDSYWEPCDDFVSGGKHPWTVPYRHEYYGDRDYRLFSYLADVRNYNSLRFLSNGRPKNHIESLPIRDFPADASAPVKAECERWEGDGHSHSWATLKELEEYTYSEAISQAQLDLVDDGDVWVNTQWVNFIARMKIMAKKSSEENIRIVFWFDN